VPALIDVVTHRPELSMPPTIELKQALGFSVYMAKAVLSGCGDEIIDLAKTNLFRQAKRSPRVPVFKKAVATSTQKCETKAATELKTGLALENF
jgi:hypothetical protein